MTRHKLYTMWIFLGSESEEPTFRGRPLDPRSYYTGHAPGRKIVSGPHHSEHIANLEIAAMANTSGT